MTTIRSSYVVAVDSALVVDGTPAGTVALGVVDGLAYLHVQPTVAPRRFVGAMLADGEIRYERELAPGEPEPDEGFVLVVGEPVSLPWRDDVALVYDPTPSPFAWDEFAAAHPEIAGQCVPHAWANESAS